LHVGQRSLPKCASLILISAEQLTCQNHCRWRLELELATDRPMKSVMLRQKLQDLGIASSYSRPRMSDDNAFIESVFRTLKHGPMIPPKRFESLKQARQWVEAFMSWYNNDHQHSGIRFVTPAQRHRGEDREILANRDEVYAVAQAANPRRWSTTTRNWSYINEVSLNPDRAVKEGLNISN